MVIELFVDKLVQGGDGLAQMDGLKVFVRYAAPQELVRARIVTRKRDYAVAEIDEVLEPSPLRVPPKCPYYGECGGCQLQHISDEGQLVVKKLLVNETLQRIGKLFVPVRNVTSQPKPWRYRNKTQYPVGAANGLSIGFFRRDSHDLLDIKECLLHPVEFDTLRAIALEAMIATGETGYIESSHAGNIKHLVLRQSSPGGAVLALVVTRTPALDRQFVETLAGHPGVAGVVQNINSAPTNRILSGRSLIVNGRGAIAQMVLGRSFRISAASFFQVNTAQAEELCNKVIKHVAPQGNETVVDLYSGVGMLSLAVAPYVGRVTGIEIGPEAVDDAIFNAHAHGVRNAEFICDDVDRAISSIEDADVVILDPPRKGCSPETLRRVVGLKPRRIVYVSCNPATLARDLAALDQLGYATHEVEPVDMFPQTFHVEMVARLSRSVVAS